MKKRTLKICLIAAAAVVAVSGIVGAAVALIKNTQFPAAEKPISAQQQSVIMKNFTPVNLNGKKEPKRVIDNKHPLNLLNYYGNEPVEELWSSIPENQKPYTVLLIIPGHTLLPGSEGSLKFLEETADKCEENKIPYAIQNVNGEIAPEERLPIAYLEERFAQKHEYFYGLNGAELYNSVIWRGEVESNNSQYIIDCVKLCAKYGAFFFWTDTNMNYDSGMILEWFETNEAFYSTFKENSKYICLLNKESFGKPTTYACMQGLWLAGLVGNWGVASDWWHWQVDGDKKSLFGEYDELVDNEWDMIVNFPENMYVQSMMLVMSAGGTCFKAEAPNFSTSVGGVPVGGYEYGISPLLDRVISGQISIPSKEEVFRDTPVAVMGYDNYPEFQYNYDESNLYPANGTYGIIPLLPENLRNDELKVFEDNKVTIVNTEEKQEFYDKFYTKSNSDTYLKRMSDKWYFINNSENQRKTKSAEFAPVISSAEKVTISAGEHTSAIITEKKDSLDFYLSNYRTDKRKMVEGITDELLQQKSWVEICGDYLVLGEDGSPINADDSVKRTTVITVKGTLNGGKPSIQWNNSADGKGYQNRPYLVDEQWDDKTKTLTLTIQHNGIVDFSVKLDKSDKVFTGTERSGFTAFTREKTGASTQKLSALINEQIDTADGIYNEYSLLKYNAALEKAKIMVSEGTYTEKEIKKAEKELTKAKENLLELSKYVELLNQFAQKDMSSEESAAFDALLREAVSNRVYVAGRSNSLGYKKLYTQKGYSKNAKIKALDKKYSELANLA